MNKNLLLFLCMLFFGITMQAQNSLSIPTVYAGIDRESKLVIEMDNTEEVVAFQFTLTVPDGLIINAKDAVLTDRTDGHALSVTKKGNKMVFIAYSMGNDPFSGNSGALIEVPFKTPTSYKEGDTHAFEFSGVILSSSKPEDIGSEHKNGELKVIDVNSPDLTISTITPGETKISPNGKLSLAWKVDNIGTAPAIGGWNEQITIISEKTGARYLLGTTSYKQDLAESISANRSAELNIPRIPAMDGNVKIEVKLIPASTVAELPIQKDNNTVIADNAIFLEKLLYLSLNRKSINENSEQATTGTITQSGDRTIDYQYAIASSPEGQFTHEKNVTITKNNATAYFYLTTIDNEEMDGDREVTITISGNEYDAVSETIQIIDDELPTLVATSSKESVTDGEEFTVTVNSDVNQAEDLILTITNDQPTRWTVPDKVTLPKGSKQVTFKVVVKNNKKPESDLTGSISVRGGTHVAGKVEVKLISSNVPQFTLEITPNVISEGDGIYATEATLSRTDKSDIPVTIKLSADIADALILPKTIDFGPGNKTKKFNIGPVDNDIVDGTREVKVTAGVYLADCNCTGLESSKTIIVLDNDGLALKVSADPSTVKAGTEDASKITITRNTKNLTKSIVVKLSSDLPSVVEIPATATILAGRESVEVSINTKIDTSLKGDQTARITAEADDFSSGFVWLLVSDQNKPDAIITEMSVDTETKGGDEIIVNATIKNQGFALLPKGTNISYYLSENQTVAEGLLLATKQLTATIEAGKSQSVAHDMSLPEQAGEFYIIAVVNADKAVSELDYKNNEKAFKVKLLPTYAATIAVEKGIYKAGETVKFTGKAIAKSRADSPYADKGVEIVMLVGGFTRTEIVKTDTQGNFAYDFTPLKNENGYYSVSAGYPGAAGEKQTSFDVLGFEWLNRVEYIKWDVVQNEPITGEFKLRNNTSIALTNVRISIPTGKGLTIESTPISLASGAEGVLQYKMTPTKVSEKVEFEPIDFAIVSDEEAKLDMKAWFYSRTQVAKLYADPVSINTTMTKGESRFYEFSLINKGAVAAENIKIELPKLAWMSLKSAPIIKTLAPYDTAKVVLLLKPTDKEQLNVPLSGTLAANMAVGGGISIPFRIETVSESTGKLRFDAVDEYTYNTPSAPHIEGAKVIVRHPFSGAVVAEGLTDTNGIFETNNLPEGYYTVHVSAKKHDSYKNNVVVDPGVTKSVKVFMPYQAISVDWTVKPIEVDDEYQIDLEVEFETNVPKPVVTMELTKQVPELEVGECFMTNILITNHGLIQAEGIQIETPVREGYTFELMTNYIDKLPAKSSIHVPMKVCKVKDVTKDCIIYIVRGIFEYYCDNETGQWIRVQTGSIFLGTMPCPTPPVGGGSGGGGWIGGPGGGSGGGWAGGGNGSGLIVHDIDCKGDDCLITFFRTAYSCKPIVTPLPQPFSSTVRCIQENESVDNVQTAITTLKCIGEVGFGETPISSAIANLQCAETIGELIYNCVPLGKWISGSIYELFGDKDPNKNLAEFRKDYARYISTMQAARNLLTTIYDANFYEENKLAELETLRSQYAELDGKITAENIQKIADAFQGSIVTKAQVIAHLQKWNLSVDAYRNGTSVSGLIDFNNLTTIVATIKANTTYAESQGFTAKDGSTAIYNMSKYIVQVLNKAKTMYEEEGNDPKTSVCASVTVQFSQRMTMTREAFEGTLTINNGNETDAITDIELDLLIEDEEGNNSNHLFQINKDAFLSGGGAVAVKETEQGIVIFIPTKEAAPTVAKSYSFGGTFSYFDASINERVTVKLHPVTLDVNPSPDLVLRYFMQRDILGDDPLTEEVEPMIPAELALMIDNQGYGTAKNVRIESMKPIIIDNKQGLLIDFDIVGSNLNNEPKELGLTNVTFGNIDPMSTAVGQWWFTSTLLGHFRKYEIKVTHLSSYGNENLSLIKDAFIHELIKSVRAYGVGHDELNDFLVNDIEDLYDTPDAIYYSTGEKDDVYRVAAASTSNIISSAKLSTTLTMAPSDNGWNYGNLTDPGKAIYKLERVVRNSDNYELPIQNFWQTSVTLRDGRDPLYENNLHFLDKITEDTEYTLYYSPSDVILPEVESFRKVTAGETTEQVKYIEVVFNKPIDFNTFTTEDITLVHNGANVSTDDILIAKVDESTYVLTMESLTATSGYYELTVQCAGIKDLVGNEGVKGKSIAWTQIIDELGISKFTSNQVKAQPIDAIELTFNKEVALDKLINNLFTLNGHAITDIAIEPKETTRAASKFDYIVKGLSKYNQEDGDYKLSINLPELEAVDGSKGLVAQTFSWTVDTKLPEVVTFTPMYQGASHSKNVTEMAIQLNKPVVNFPLASVKLYRNNKEVSTSLTIAKENDLEYIVSGLGEYTQQGGSYGFAVDQTQLVDEVGNVGVDEIMHAWIISFDKPLPVSGLKITPDRGESNKDNITSGKDLQLSLSVQQDAKTLVINTITPLGSIKVTEQFVANASDVLIPIGDTYSGNVTFEVYVFDEQGNKSESVTIDAYIDVVDFDYTVSVHKSVCNEISRVTISFSDDIDADDLKDAIVLKVGDTTIPMSNMTITQETSTIFVIEDLAHLVTSGSMYLGIDMKLVHKKLSGLEGKGLRFDLLGDVVEFNLMIEGDALSMVGKEGRYRTNADMTRYRWVVVGGEILAQSGNEVLVRWLQSGTQTITLELKDSENCERIAFIDVDVEGINLLDSEKTVKVYPTPSDGAFTVAFSSEGQHNVGITITDLGGVVVYRKTNIQMKNTLTRNIDLKPCKPGVYLVIIDKGGKRYTTRTVVL